jgi:hypothetical protein
MNVIKNGKFSEGNLKYWIDDSADDCDIYKNNGLIYEPIGIDNIVNNFPPLADNFDALTVPKQGPGLDQRCSLKQNVEFRASSQILYAQISWVDRITTQANNNLYPQQYARVSIQVQDELDEDTDPVAIFTTTNSNTDTSTVLRKTRLADVTSLIAGMSGPDGLYKIALTLDEAAFFGPLYYQWDNVELWVCLSEKPADPEGGGDPHFKTWSGEKYTYHGACDLVLLHSESFGGGLGLDIHVRTKQHKNFSYITHAAVRIGDDVFEVVGNLNKDYYLNGDLHVDMPASISGYPIEYSSEDPKRQKFTIILGDGQQIVIKTWRDFVTVKVENGNYQSFFDSVGLMGKFVNGHKVARDGTTIMDDLNAFGQEWQVTHNEPMLFQSLVMPQYPQQCVLPTPSTAQRRRLGEPAISEAMAAAACAHVEPEDRSFCIYDVLATNDMDMAGAY